MKPEAVVMGERYAVKQAGKTAWIGEAFNMRADGAVIFRHGEDERSAWPEQLKKIKPKPKWFLIVDKNNCIADYAMSESVLAHDYVQSMHNNGFRIVRVKEIK